MDFSKKLNEYMEMLECNGKELSIATNIKQPIISCYRNNTRIPKYNSDNYNNLISGLLIISKNKNINLSEENIRDTFKACFEINNVDFNIFRNNFNYLINYLKINISDLSKYIGFDSSFISKIKSGIRKPANLNEFVTKVSKFIINNYKNNLQELIKNEVNYHNLYIWLTQNKEHNSLIISKNTSKLYYNLHGYKEAILDALKQSTIQTNKEIYLYINMNLSELNKDLSFLTTITNYINKILENGNKIKVIHSLINQNEQINFWLSFNNEQIILYNIEDNSRIYKTFDFISDSVILHAECVLNDIDTSKIIVSNKKNDIKYYQENMNLIFKEVKPTIDFFKKT